MVAPVNRGAGLLDRLDHGLPPAALLAPTLNRELLTQGATIGSAKQKHNDIMMLTFYHSPLCPRCRRAGRLLTELLGSDGRYRFSRIDALRHPLVSWRAGIRMIPALTCDGEVLSGLTLDRERLTAFLVRHQLIDPPETSRRP